MRGEGNLADYGCTTDFSPLTESHIVIKKEPEVVVVKGSNSPSYSGCGHSSDLSHIVKMEANISAQVKMDSLTRNVRMHPYW